MPRSELTDKQIGAMVDAVPDTLTEIPTKRGTTLRLGGATLFNLFRWCIENAPDAATPAVSDVPRVEFELASADELAVREARLVAFSLRDEVRRLIGAMERALRDGDPYGPLEEALAACPAIAPAPILPEVTDADLANLRRLRGSHKVRQLLGSQIIDSASRILALCEWARTHATTRTEGE